MPKDYNRKKTPKFFAHVENMMSPDERAGDGRYD